MYENPFDRKFGIEFEFACNIPYDTHAYSRTSSKIENFENILVDNNLSNFRIGRDGSEWEVKTPILQGPTGFKKVKRFLEIVNDMGARVSMQNDGLHVHHDAPEFIDRRNKESLVRLVENWYTNQNQIMSMVHRVRRNGWACPVWNEHDVYNLKNQHQSDWYFGRKNLNISALQRHGTIEFRLHEGTLNYEEVLSWVRFGQSFINKALDETDGYLEAAETPIDLMKKINVSRSTSRFMARKLNPALVNSL